MQSNQGAEDYVESVQDLTFRPFKPVEPKKRNVFNPRVQQLLEKTSRTNIVMKDRKGKTTLLNHAPMSTKALHSRQSVNDFNFIGPTFKQPLISKKVFPG